MFGHSIIAVLLGAFLSVFSLQTEEASYPSAFHFGSQFSAAFADRMYTTDDHSSYDATELTAIIDEILLDPRLSGASTSVSVRRADTGELLYSHQGNVRLHPASNMKILTAVAALETLGPEYRFSTEVWTDGSQDGNVLNGNVYLKGQGDPTLMKEDLDRFAAELKAQGITHITGHLVGDDSWYDDVRLSLDLNWSDEPYYTGAQISALTLSPNTDFDAGTVIVEVSPLGVGEAPQVKLIPATDYVTIVNEATTVAKGATNTIQIEREHGTNRIVIEGTIPVGGSPTRSRVSVWEPTGYALDVFRKSLEQQGITWSAISEQVIGTVPEHATRIAEKQSIPLKELLVPFMKLSNNGLGETLTKEMGKIRYGEGSWEEGLKVIHETIVQFGVNGGTIRLRDGSGMSHKTLIPAHELTKLLYAVQEASWYPIFEQSLPVAGARDRMAGGTLSHRMRGTPAEGNVRAKTGSLTGVSTLSGYVTTAGGEKLIFAILINNYLVPTVRPIEDRITSALASWTGG